MITFETYILVISRGITMFNGWHWLPSNQSDNRAIALYMRHYSARHYKDGRRRTQFVGPGEKMVLLTPDCTALLVGRRPKYVGQDGQEGVNCTIFRNEGYPHAKSSELIQAACKLAWDRWPGERLYTYVEDAKIESVNPGYCFKMAGWKTCGRNADGRLTILECQPAPATDEGQG